MTYLAGYDISGVGQGNWTPSPAGLAFAFVKASEGNTPDFAWVPHASALLSHQGLALGGYHFGRREWSAQVQARTYLDTVGDKVEMDVLDYEYAVNKTLMTQAQARAFIKIVKAATKRPIGLYGSLRNPWNLFPPDNYGADFGWVALPGSPNPPPVKWTFWQYTFVPFDHDYFNGDAAALAALLGRPSGGGSVAMTNRSGYPHSYAAKAGDPFYAKAGDSTPIGSFSANYTVSVQGRVIDPGGGWYEAWVTTSAGYTDDVARPSGVYLHLPEPVIWAS